MTLAPGTLLGHYEVVALIGAGGMGEVYRARDTRLGREIALKILPDAFSGDSDRLVRFEREARVLAALNHPNIAGLHGVEESGHVKALVLELVEGPTLAELLLKGPLPVSPALEIAVQVAEAIEAAHAAAVVHRDLKPANIKIQNTRVKVLDYGLAKAMDVAEPRASLSNSPTVTTPQGTRYGLLLGTAAYMSPEQARGEPVDGQTDIWAFGCVLFEMLTGRPVFDGRSVSDVIAAILRAEPDWSLLPSALHPRIRLLLERCLEKDRANRYHSIADVRVDLQRTIADPKGPTPARQSHASYSLAWYWVAAAAVISAAAGGAAVWSLRAPRDIAVRQFTDVLPEDRGFTNVGHPLVAVSRDASLIAYVAERRIFLRSQDRNDATPIAGTEGSPSTPFFSPDSQFIGYFDFSDGELRRIPIGGGAPVGLVKVTNLFGARWEADNTIVYGADTGIWRVSGSGGTPERLVGIDGGARVHAPQLLPGGESVLFTLRAGVGSALWDASEVVVHSLKTGERKTIRPGRDARYLSTGHIVYASNATLFAIGFDPARLATTGAPIPVAEGLRFAGQFPGMTGSANYDVSDSGTLVYVRGAPQPPASRQLVAVDRQGNATPLVTEPRDYWRPRVSPDGKRVAVEVRDDRGEHVWIIDLEDGNASPLESEALRSVFTTWMPDGLSVLYRMDRLDRYGIYRQPADASEAPRLVLEAAEDVMPGHVSRDGVFVFAAGEQTGRRAIWTMRLDESRATEFLATPALEHMPLFSPDGRWIAYASNESGRSEVYVRAYPPNDVPARLISERGGTAPLWSPTGDELFYRDAAGTLVAVPMRAGARAGRAQELFQVQGRFRISGNAAAYDIERSGRRFIMVTEPDNPRPVREQISVIVNWFEELNRLAPISR